MKVNREKLLATLECVAPGLSTREMIEQSSCFAFQDGRVFTYNEEMACSHSSPLKIEGAVQSGALLEILRVLPDKMLDIEPGDGVLRLRGKRKKTDIRMEGKVVLPIESVEVPKKWRPLSEQFSEAVDLVRHCASKDETIHMLTCLHVHPKYVEACDNAQYARYRLKGVVEEPILVRADAVKHIAPLGMTEIGESENWVHFRNPDKLVLSCRRTLDPYQDFSGFLKESGRRITLPKTIAKATTAAGTFSKENDQDLIEVQLRPGWLCVEGRGQSGRHWQKTKVAYDGPEFYFLISPELLGDLVSRHSDCELTDNTLRVTTGRFTYSTSLGKIASNGEQTKKSKKKKKSKKEKDELPF